MISETRLLAVALRPLGRLVVAEQFLASPTLSAIAVPSPPLVAGQPTRAILIERRTGALHSAVIDYPREAEDLLLRFPAFANLESGGFVLLLLQPAKSVRMQGWQRRLTMMITARRPPITLRCEGAAAAVGEITVVGEVTASWRENGGCYAEGWVAAPTGRVIALASGATAGRLSDADGGKSRFSMFVPDWAGSSLTLRAETDQGKAALSLPLPPAALPSAGLLAREMADKAAAFARFIDEVNRPGIEILEIGSRLVGSLSEPLRERFPNARRYVGIDVHPGPTVDVVGDAHELSRMFGPASFDAVFSAAVLEHLAMPWIIAAEINRVLRPGGLTYHITPQAWPVHEVPNDFWRFSDEALKLLFGEPFGFEVLSAGMADRARMYPLDKETGNLGLPLGFGYASAWVLARKLRDIDRSPPALLTDLGRRYPA